MSEKTDNKVPNVPNLRFFEDSWEFYSFGDLFNVANGINKEKESFGVGYPIVNYMDVNKHAFLKKDMIFGLVNSTQTEQGTYSILPNDLIVTRTSETIDEIAYSSCLLEEIPHCVFSGFLLRARPLTNKTHTIFMVYELRSETYRKVLKKYSTETSRALINSENLKKVPLCIPSLENQQKIASFLVLIDERIETQSKIINCLESLLNEISHHYFGSLSSAEIALSKIADIYQPKTISQSECSENGTYNVFGANGIIGKFNQYNHDLPQICITCRGSTSGNVFMTESYSWITGNAMVINIDKNLEIVNKTFLYYYLSSMSFKNIISGSGQPQIVREPLMKIKIKLPSLEEQLRFEKIINSFASKLQKEKDILALYKKQKAYLLANMFI